MAVTREQIVTEAREWIGTPWQHNTCKKGKAVDCAQMVVGTGRNCEAFRPGQLESSEMEKFVGYPMEPIPKLMLQALNTLLVPVKEGKLGDVCFFFVPRFGGGGDPQHLGIISRVSSNMYVIHAYNKPGIDRVVESRVVNPGYIRGMWQFPMVEED